VTKSHGMHITCLSYKEYYTNQYHLALPNKIDVAKEDLVITDISLQHTLLKKQIIHVDSFCLHYLTIDKVNK
jgi:hypothetical protein